MSEAVLFSQMQPGAEWEDEFNDWYDREHVPNLRAVSVVRRARRYRQPSPTEPLRRWKLDRSGGVAPAMSDVTSDVYDPNLLDD